MWQKWSWRWACRRVPSPRRRPMVDIKALCVAPETPMLQVMARINENQHGIALVVDSAGHLTDTITDGDLRRAILAGKDLNLPISSLLARRTEPPVTAPLGVAPDKLVRLMKENSGRQLPLLDAAGRLADVAF